MVLGSARSAKTSKGVPPKRPLPGPVDPPPAHHLTPASEREISGNVEKRQAILAEKRRVRWTDAQGMAEKLGHWLSSGIGTRTRQDKLREFIEFVVNGQPGGRSGVREDLEGGWTRYSRDCGNNRVATLDVKLNPMAAIVDARGPAHFPPRTPPGSTPSHSDSGSASSGRLQRIEVPVEDIRQQKTNACGDACVNVLLAYHGLPHASFGTNNNRWTTGVDTRTLSQELRKHNLRAVMLRPTERNTISSADLSRWLHKHGPLICETPDHFIVVNGIKGDRVSIHCPLLGKRTGSVAALNRYLDWSDPRTPPIMATARMPNNLVGDPAASTSSVQPALPNALHRAATRQLAKLEAAATKDWKTAGKGKGKDPA